MAILIINRMNRGWDRLIGDVEAIFPDEHVFGVREDVDKYLANFPNRTFKDFTNETKFWQVKLIGLSVAQAEDSFLGGEQLGWSHPFVDLKPLGAAPRAEVNAAVAAQSDAFGQPYDIRSILPVAGKKRLVGIDVPAMERRVVPPVNPQTGAPVDAAKENLHTHLRITRLWVEVSSTVQSRVAKSTAR